MLYIIVELCYNIL